MGRPQRFRGVRQRHWGSWVSEIRHPLLKTRVWLGTFETAEDAAKAYDEAARLMSGPRAKTNFPLDPKAPLPATSLLSSTLVAKLQRCYLMSLSQVGASGQKDSTPGHAQSLTCLRLDPEKSNLGVWQKKGGRDSKSNWVMTLQLDNKIKDDDSQIAPANRTRDRENEDLIASQMIEELLGCNSALTKIPSPSRSGISSSSSDSAVTTVQCTQGMAPTAFFYPSDSVSTSPALENELWNTREPLVENGCNWFFDSAAFLQTF